MTRERMLRRRRRRDNIKKIGKLNLMLWCVLPGLKVIAGRIKIWNEFWSSCPEWIYYILLVLQLVLFLCSLVYMISEWIGKRRNKEPWE